MGYKKHILKKILIFISIFTFGVITGIVGISRIEKRQQVTDEINIVSYLLFESEEVTNQYFSFNNVDNSIYALEHFVKFKNFFSRKYLELPTSQEKSKWGLFDKNIPFDNVLAYTRLGFLYEKKGEQEKADQSFGKGLEIVLTHKLFEGWKGTQKEIKTVEDLKRFVVEVDDRQGENAMGPEQGTSRDEDLR